jgi:hypothetical protein
MPFPYDAADVAAIGRLDSLYNGGDYDAGSNPGGFGNSGHRTNFVPALQDVALIADAISSAATSASTSATNAGASETSAAASAAKLQGTSTTSLAIGTGSKAFTTQASKFFNVGTFVVIVSAANPTVNYMAGQVTGYVGAALTVNVTVTAGSGTFSDWSIYVAGSPGATGPAGATGAMGVTPDYQFLFSDGTTDSDPGNGLLKQNNAAVASTTQLYIDNLERNGSSITAWLDSFDDSTNTALRGTITIVQLSDPTKIAVFNVTSAVVDGTGYRKVPVAYVSGPGGFTNAAVLAMRFSRTGNAGLNGDGAGDVLGPASAADNQIALFDGTTGKLLKAGGTVAAVATSGAASDVINTPAGTIAATTVQAALNELDGEKRALAAGTDENLVDNVEFRVQQNGLSDVTTGSGGFTSGNVFVDRWRLTDGGSNGARAAVEPNDASVALYRSSGSGGAAVYQHFSSGAWRVGYGQGRRRLFLQFQAAAAGSAPSGDLTVNLSTVDTVGSFTAIAVRGSVTVTPSQVTGGWTTFSVEIVLPDSITQLGMYLSFNAAGISGSSGWSFRRPSLRWIEQGGAQVIPWTPRDEAIEELRCKKYLQYITLNGLKGAASGSTTILLTEKLAPKMNAAPTVSLALSAVTAAAFQIFNAGSFHDATLSLSGTAVSAQGISTQIGGFTTLTAGIVVGNTDTRLLKLSAEI